MVYVPVERCKFSDLQKHITEMGIKLTNPTKSQCVTELKNRGVFQIPVATPTKPSVSRSSGFTPAVSRSINNPLSATTKRNQNVFREYSNPVYVSEYPQEAVTTTPVELKPVYQSDKLLTDSAFSNLVVKGAINVENDIIVRDHNVLHTIDQLREEHHKLQQSYSDLLTEHRYINDAITDIIEKQLPYYNTSSDIEFPSIQTYLSSLDNVVSNSLKVSGRMIV